MTIPCPSFSKRNNVYSHLITDHQHYWEDGGATYHNRYSSYEFVRGQEGDPWKGVVDPPFKIPKNTRTQAAHDTADSSYQLWRQDWINRSYMPSTRRAVPNKAVFNLGLEFIETNIEADNWFLQIETFDPHEPYFTHEEYKKLYPHEYDGPHFDWPPYAPVTQSATEIEHMRF